MIKLENRASDDLIIGASKLNDAGVFSTTQDVIDFFDKPWKWSEELKEIMEINKLWKKN